MKALTIGMLIVSGIVALALGACSEEAPPPPAASPELTRARPAIDQVLSAYEAVRSQLARDELSTTTESAAVLEERARGAAGQAAEAQRTHLTAVASAASSLKDMPKDDADAVREAFGEVSSAVVALLSTHPSLQQSLHVFECPMVQGYQRWVQTNTDISNPYMGSRMLACGTPAPWGS